MAFTDHPSILSECAKSLLEKDPKNIFALSINRLITKYCNLKIEVYDKSAYRFNDPARDFRDSYSEMMLDCTKNLKLGDNSLKSKGMMLFSTAEHALKQYSET